MAAKRKVHASGSKAQAASAGVAVSMDGRGRALDDVFVERLSRTVKYEDIDIQGDETVPGLHLGPTSDFAFYNDELPHQFLVYGIPAAVYRGTKGESREGSKTTRRDVIAIRTHRP